MKQKVMIAIGVLALVGVAQYFGLVPGMRKTASAVPQAFSLSTDAPDAGRVARVSNVALQLPSTRPCGNGAALRVNIWAWNAQMGFLLANGGSQTTCQSLMQKHGVSLKIARQDDTNQTQAEQVKFATALASGDETQGTQFAVIMGDGAAQYLASIDKALLKLGPDYVAEIVGALGYSRGEDAWWGPQEWKDAPEAMKGGASAGVLRDGDWNIAQYKLANDQIKNNPDEKTWDPDAMNWFAADDYLKAVELYVSGYCEDRPVVRNGKLTNEAKHHTCVQGVVTWTPGDVNLAKNKGGLVRLLSTKENVYQMPAVVIGIHRFDVARSKQIEGLLAATFEGSDQIKQYPQALSAAARVSANVYNEKDAGYWAKYYRGAQEQDKQGISVPLGGSTVMNLADNLVLFGLADGTGGIDNSLFKATYEGFGNISKQQYPKLVPDFPKTQQAVNLTFLTALQKQAAPADTQNAELQDFTGADTSVQAENVVAKRNWAIQFDTGKATFSPQAESALESLYQQLVVGGALQVQVSGHTDSVGSPSANLDLSQRRARAVADYLQEKAGKLFPEGRIVTKGLGDSQPIAPNDSEAGRAKNRRVEVVLGAKS